MPVFDVSKGVRVKVKGLRIGRQRKAWEVSAPKPKTTKDQRGRK
jgi:hypothetical protein